MFLKKEEDVQDLQSMMLGKKISFHLQEEVSTALKHMKTQEFSSLVNFKKHQFFTFQTFIHQPSAGKSKAYDYFFSSVCILYRQYEAKALLQVSNIQRVFCIK